MILIFIFFSFLLRQAQQLNEGNGYFKFQIFMQAIGEAFWYYPQKSFLTQNRDIFSKVLNDENNDT